MIFYLASRYQDHPLMRDWRIEIERHGWLVSSRWIDGDHEITGTDDENERRRFAAEDMEDVQRANVVIVRSDPAFFRTGRGGRHVELGLALAWRKRIILVGERENVFHWLMECVPTLAAALELCSDHTDTSKAQQHAADRLGDLLDQQIAGLSAEDRVARIKDLVARLRPTEPTP